MENRRLATGLPNYLRMIERIMGSIEPEPFWARFPRLKQRHEALGLPFTPTELAEPLASTAAISLFGAVRLDSPPHPDWLAGQLLDALRLDLQGCAPAGEQAIRNDGSEGDRQLASAIGLAMGLPFDVANYLCHISHRHRYLYVATPKVACTAIKHALQRYEMNGDLHFRRYGEEHLPAISPLLAPGHDPNLFLSALGADDWFRFTFVRNPYSRALSCYLDKIVNSSIERKRLLPLLDLDPDMGIPSFAGFLSAVAVMPVESHDLHWAPQAWLTQPARMRYHFIGRLESFDRDIRHVADLVGFEVPDGEARHSTGADEKRAAYFGPAEIELVRSIYADDFSTFGYDPKELGGA